MHKLIYYTHNNMSFRSCASPVLTTPYPLKTVKFSTHNTHKRYEYHETYVGLYRAAQAPPV